MKRKYNKSSTTFIILLATRERDRKPSLLLPPDGRRKKMRQRELPPSPRLSSPLLSSPHRPTPPASLTPPPGRARPLRLQRPRSAPRPPRPRRHLGSGAEWRRGAALRKRRARLDGSAAPRSPSEAPTLWSGLRSGGEAGWQGQGQGVKHQCASCKISVPA